MAMRMKVMAALLTAALVVGLGPAAAFGDVKAAEGPGGLATSSAGSAVVEVHHFGVNGLARTADGSLWAWGDNDHGQLGVGSGTATAKASLPVKVMGGVAQSSLGGDSGSAVRSDGTLWTWGYNYGGKLGDGTKKDRSTPKRIMSGVKEAYMGEFFCIALKIDGTVWTWGDSMNYELGDDGGSRAVPRKIMSGVVQVAAGADFAAAVKSDGSLWMWGGNYYGQVGNGSDERSVLPVKVMDDVKRVALGAVHCGAIRSDGTLWMWGNNTTGQVGAGSSKYQKTPVKVLNDVRDVSLGGHAWGAGYVQPAHTVAVKNDGSLWAWGSDGYGQLGDGKKSDRSKPARIMDGVKSVFASGFGTVAVKADGTAWTWGNTGYGTIAGGYSSQSLYKPVRIHNGSNWEISLPAFTTVRAIDAQTYTGSAVKPSPVVEVNGTQFDQAGATTLVKGRDYAVSYSDNVAVGTAKVTVTGKGAYTGSITARFSIGKPRLSGVALKAASATYDGKPHKPPVKAVRAGSLSVPRSGYAVTYWRGSKKTSDFKSAGKVTVKAAGKGSFAGTSVTTFEIGKAANPMKASAVAKAVKLPKGKKALAKAATVSGTVKLARKAAGAVTYARVVADSAKCLKVNRRTGKVIVAKGAKAGTYKVKVDVKAAGNTNYKAKTQRLTLTVRVRK